MPKGMLLKVKLPSAPVFDVRMIPSAHVEISALGMTAPKGSSTKPERLPSPLDVLVLFALQMVLGDGTVPKCERTTCLAHDVSKQSEHRLRKLVVFKEPPRMVLCESGIITQPISGGAPALNRQ
jgi:hypothetical protein